MTSPPRVVVDTSVVLSCLVFTGSATTRIRIGWQTGRFIPLASTASAKELVRALAYPKFRLSAADQDELLADYMPWVKAIRIPEPPPRAPLCRDADDMPFVHLAIAGRARALVTGDRDLLALDGAPGLCPILRIAAFCDQFLRD